MEITLCYCPFPSQKIAEETIELLLAEKLIACGNVFLSDSIYSWLNKLTKDNEYVAILKTMPNQQVALENRILAVHPYEVPAILHWKVQVNEAYYNWVKEMVGEA